MYNQLEPEQQSQEQLVAALLNDYLEHVTAPLVDVATYQEREAVRMELRQHIEALADAHEELGSDRAEAMRAAIAQFGESGRIGSDMARQMGRSILRPMLIDFRHRFVRLVPGAVVGAMVSRVADLSMVYSGVVTYDSGWFLVLVGAGMGALVDHLISAGRCISPLRGAVKGGAVFGGIICAILLAIGTLGTKFAPLPLFAFAISRFVMAGSVSGMFSSVLARLWPRRRQTIIPA